MVNQQNQGVQVRLALKMLFLIQSRLEERVVGEWATERLISLRPRETQRIAAEIGFEPHTRFAADTVEGVVDIVSVIRV